MKGALTASYVAFAITVWLSDPVQADQPNAENSAHHRLEDAWKAEIQGDARTRRRLLNGLLDQDPKTPLARWALGQIELDGVWRNYDYLPYELQSNKDVTEYRKIRGDSPMTYRGQLELANWCNTRRLRLREQAHLTAALELSQNPNDPALRTRLGHRFANGVWRSQEDWERLKQSQIEAEKSLKKWKPIILKLAGQLESRRDTVRRQAMKKLKSVTDRDALPALEAVLGNAGLDAGRLLVEILGQFPSHRAAESLARLAVLSPWHVVREDASKQLRSRPYGAYVPELLASLATPTSARIRLTLGSGGVHLLQSFVRETQSARQVFNKRSSKYITPVRQSSLPLGELDQAKLNRATVNSALDANLRGLAAKRAVDAQNEHTKEWNGRVCNVLSNATGIQLPPQPDAWWAWWSDYNQMTEEEKEYQWIEYVESAREMVPVGAPVVQEMIVPTAPPRECLVAGTPIWTDRGPVPVEAVQVGDLVLAKHPESGELRYRQVLKTTERQAEPVMKVTTANSGIVATGGHTFWISGRGWTKLRDVKPGEQFHGVSGPVQITKVEPYGTEKTYNLVVSGVHTYFAGDELILSHDVTVAEPVDALIPGASAR